MVTKVRLASLLGQRVEAAGAGTPGHPHSPILVWEKLFQSGILPPPFEVRQFWAIADRQHSTGSVPDSRLSF